LSIQTQDSEAVSDSREAMVELMKPEQQVLKTDLAHG
jgi:hypothetical protein